VHGTRGLRGRTRELVPAARDLRDLAGRLDQYKHGIAQTADTISGAFSTQDRGGGLAQIDVMNIEPLRPENFGAGAGADRELLARRVARALELTCRKQNPYACLLRFGIPGLPEGPLTGGGG
jgi:hypothetical protein